MRIITADELGVRLHAVHVKADHETKPYPVLAWAFDKDETGRITGKPMILNPDRGELEIAQEFLTDYEGEESVLFFHGKEAAQEYLDMEAQCIMR